MYKKAMIATFIYGCVTVCWSVEPYGKDGTLGKYLEKVFSKSISSCNITALHAKRGVLSGEVPVSSVPKSLQTHLDVQAKVAWQEANSIARVFAFVYPDESYYMADLGRAWLLTEDTLANGDLTLVPDGVRRVGYNFDCAATIAAAIEANSDLTFPVATVSAALSAKYSGTKKSTLTLASGTFESPLGKMLDAASGKDGQFFGLMYQYDWYTKHPATSKGYKIVDSIEGVSLVELMKLTESTEGKADAKAALHFPLFNVNSSSSLKKEINEALSVEGYYVATLLDAAGNPRIHWRSLDTPGAIADKMKNHTARVDPVSDLNPLPGLVATHKQMVAGMPAQFCNDLVWGIDASKHAGLRLKDVRPSAENSLVCEFTVQYEVPATATDRIRLDYQFYGKNYMYGEKDQVKLSLPVEPVYLKINRDPVVVATQADPKPKSSQSWLSWNVQFLVQDGSAVADLSKLPLINSSAIKCPDRAAFEASAENLELKVAQKTGVFSLKYLPPPGAVELDKISDADFVRCGAEVEIVFEASKAGASPIVKRFNVLIYLPKSALGAPSPASADAGMPAAAGLARR
ncbi:hypothetical protein ACLB1G_04540 [Oxalobacteraceae bacterium A2-2]